MDIVKLRDAVSNFLQANDDYAVMLRDLMDSALEAGLSDTEVRRLWDAQRKRDELELVMYAILSGSAPDGPELQPTATAD